MTSIAVRPTGSPTPPPPELPEFLAVRVERYYRERVRDTWEDGTSCMAGIPVRMRCI